MDADQVRGQISPKALTQKTNRLQVVVERDIMNAPRGRAGNQAVCATCGTTLATQRASRRQKYCSYRCRDTARRERNFATFSATRYPYLGKPRSVRNRPLLSKDCKGVFADRPPRINAVPRRVIERELFADRGWLTITSPDGVVCQVASAGAFRLSRAWGQTPPNKIR